MANYLITNLFNRDSNFSVGSKVINLMYWNRPSKILTQGIRIGRSRNSEFGRVKAQQVNLNSVPQLANHGSSLTLWCISDALFFDETGAPSVEPSFTGVIDNAEFTLDPTHSFCAHAERTSRFNQKRGGYDSEVMLVEKGSVFQFRVSRDLTNEELNRLAAAWLLDCKTELGLGQVVVNPAWAQVEQLHVGDKEKLFNAISFEAVQLTQNKNTSGASSALTRWVSSVAGDAQSALAHTDNKPNLFLRTL